MAGLRATFEPWMEDEPAEPEGDNPPAEEMELYDELAKQHKKQVGLHISSYHIMLLIPCYAVVCFSADPSLIICCTLFITTV